LSADFDVAVVGSGFAGSLTAMCLRRLGRSVVLLESGAHPRFAIGESSSPLANLLLEALCERYDLPRIAPLSAWGSWQRAYPEIGCGLKRGFTFYAHRPGERFEGREDRADQLLVAASPCDEVADTHWYRPDFDHFLVGEAAAEGATYLDRTRIDGIAFDASGAALETVREGRSRRLRVRLVVDASGPRGFLHRALHLEEHAFPGLPSTQGLYTHFTGVARLDEMRIFPSADQPPYPPDDAAVHHVFDGGWIWVLRFGNGITSAGVAAASRLADELGFSEGEPAWRRLLDRFPTIRDQFADARPLLPFTHRERLPFRTRLAAGPGWTLLPSAAAFVDPILSTGFPLALLGIERLAAAVEEDWDRPAFAGRLARDGWRSLEEADTAARLVAALYARFADFPLFVELTKLYFAAASFAEAARRLGRPSLSGAFLSGDHSTFGPALADVCARATVSGSPRPALLESIAAAVSPLDVIGLSDAGRHNWYPVEAQDLLEAAPKLGATRGEIEELLARMLPAAVTPGRTSGAARSR
jgi:tetracycline 7-halogenase / FADH2 O2-dependent halogenase